MVLYDQSWFPSSEGFPHSLFYPKLLSPNPWILLPTDRRGSSPWPNSFAFTSPLRFPTTSWRTKQRKKMEARSFRSRDFQNPPLQSLETLRNSNLSEPPFWSAFSKGIMAISGSFSLSDHPSCLLIRVSVVCFVRKWTETGKYVQIGLWLKREWTEGFLFVFCRWSGLAWWEGRGRG